MNEQCSHSESCSTFAMLERNQRQEQQFWLPEQLPNLDYELNSVHTVWILVLFPLITATPSYPWATRCWMLTPISFTLTWIASLRLSVVRSTATLKPVNSSYTSQSNMYQSMEEAVLFFIKQNCGVFSFFNCFGNFIQDYVAEYLQNGILGSFIQLLPEDFWIVFQHFKISRKCPLLPSNVHLSTFKYCVV